MWGKFKVSHEPHKICLSIRRKFKGPPEPYQVCIRGKFKVSHESYKVCIWGKFKGPPEPCKVYIRESSKFLRNYKVFIWENVQVDQELYKGCINKSVPRFSGTI